ncbi:hypothetical protein evm_012322 [Chilo suppressalis]|nr:hypothetical protein evm_012322 [Chilo suppressalis]
MQTLSASLDISLCPPWEARPPWSTRTNDLEYYEAVTREDGPAMTWSMHAIGRQDAGQQDRADELFHRSYADYVREPFKVWSEESDGSGAVNFLTGMGGLLQALAAGRAGLRLSLAALTIRRPVPPPHGTRLTIRGIQYLGANLTLEVEQARTTLRVNSLYIGGVPLTFYNGLYNVTLVPDMTVTLSGEGPFTISAPLWKNCKLPSDTIGHNYLRPIET